jgi:hypothetical protein
MNKQIFIDICDRIESEVPELKWIDLDNGDIDIQTERPPVAFPACFIDISYPNCEDQADSEQLVRANIIIRLAFQPQGASNNKSPVRARALEIFDIVEKVHSALQGWHNAGAFSTLSRISASAERRRDGLKVYRLLYQTTFIDSL